MSTEISETTMNFELPEELQLFGRSSSSSRRLTCVRYMALLTNSVPSGSRHRRTRPRAHAPATAPPTAAPHS